MKGLQKAIGVGLVCVPLLLGGCKQEYMTLRGSVFSERYMPASGQSGFFTSPVQSKYSFSMDTEFGRKGIQVESTREVTKESIDAMIEPGTKVEIFVEQNSFTKNLKDQQIYQLTADKIRVLGK